MNVLVSCVAKSLNTKRGRVAGMGNEDDAHTFNYEQ